MLYTSDHEILQDTKKILATENMSQKEFAEKIGLTEFTVSKHFNERCSLLRVRQKYIEFNAKYGYTGNHEPIFDESFETKSEDIYKMMTVEELTDIINNLKTIRAEKIRSEMKKVEEEIVKLYERQESYEKLLKEES